MSKRGVLSSKFNMSLGFIPVIVSIILCEFITQDISIYIGAGVGALYSLYTLWGKGARIPIHTFQILRQTFQQVLQPPPNAPKHSVFVSHQYAQNNPYASPPFSSTFFLLRSFS